MSRITPARILPAWLVFGVIALQIAATAKVLYDGQIDTALNVLDGNYQTYAMLTRLGDGMVPGIDYVPYLGVLLNYALFVPFFLFGKTIPATFLIASFATLGATWFLAATASWCAGFSRRDALVLGATLVAVQCLVIAPDAGPSLIVIREMAFVPAVLILALAPRSFRTWLLFGICLGAMFFWSPTAGAAQVLAGLMIVLLLPGARAMRTAATLIGAVLGLVVTLLLLSHGRPSIFLRRVFLDIGDSQFWFYGPFADGSRATTIWQVVGILWSSLGVAVPVAMGAVTVATVGVRAGWPSRRASVAIMIGVSMLASCIAAQTFGHLDPHYARPLALFSAQLALALILNWLATRQVGLPGWTRGVSVAAVLGLVCATVLRIPPTQKLQVPTGRLTLPEGVPAPAIGLNTPLKARTEALFLSDLKARFDGQGVPPEKRMFSFYYGWQDKMLGTASDPEFHSIIHVFKPEQRARYLASLRTARPALISAPNDGSPYARWMRQANWYVYREMLAHYRPLAAGSLVTYWVRTPTANGTPAADARCALRQIAPDEVEATIDDPAGGRILDLRIEYRASLPPKFLPGFGTGHGYVRVDDRSLAALKFHDGPWDKAYGMGLGMFSPGGTYFGLPKNGSLAEMPIETQPGERASVRLQMIGAPGSIIEARRCFIAGAYPSGRSWPAPISLVTAN